MIFGLMLVGMVFETLGIGLVIPVLALLTQADVMTQFQNFPTLCRFEVIELDSWHAEGLFEHPSIPGAKMQEYFTTQTLADA